MHKVVTSYNSSLDEELITFPEFDVFESLFSYEAMTCCVVLEDTFS